MNSKDCKSPKQYKISNATWMRITKEEWKEHSFIKKNVEHCIDNIKLYVVHGIKKGRSRSSFYYTN